MHTTDLILSALKERGICGYLITEQRVSSAELFFIKKNLDMRRSNDSLNYHVTVFRKIEEGDKRFLGSSSCAIYPGMSSEEIGAAVSKAYAAAEFVKNPAYETYRGDGRKPKVKTGLEGDLSEIAGAFSTALFAADDRTDAFVNSAEFFVTRKEVRILSSEDVDVSFVSTVCTGEFVAQCKEPQDVEQYFSFAYDTMTPESLTEKVRNALNTVCDRAHATQMPDTGIYDVVLSGDNLSELINLYLDRASASFIFSHYSDYEVGKQVQGSGSDGEKLNLFVLPDDPYSRGGIPMKKRPLLTGGVLDFIHGPTRLCRYLGIEPAGIYERMELENGTVPFEELKQGTLYPVTFSDFQLDSMSGRFGGEIRLAYLYTPEGIKIVTGGSINGSLLEKQDELIFSLERYRSLGYTGPLAVRIPGVAVSGK